MKRFICLLVSMIFFGLFYVYSEVEAVKIGYTIRKQEEAKVQSLDRARALKYNIARLKAPHNLQKQLLSQKIMLESPKSWQTLILSNGGTPAKNQWLKNSLGAPPIFTKFFVGTAQAEAKEQASSR